MSIDELKSCLTSFFDFNYAYAFVIGIFLFCIYISLMKKRNEDYAMHISRRLLCLGVIFSSYLALILGATLLGRSIGVEYGIKLVPFWSYYEVIVNGNTGLFQQMIANIVVFVPWGILIPLVREYMEIIKPCNNRLVITLASVLLFSGSIEIIQLIFRCGLFEFDDIFHNTLGAIIGYGIWRGRILIKQKINYLNGESE